MFDDPGANSLRGLQDHRRPLIRRSARTLHVDSVSRGTRARIMDRIEARAARRQRDRSSPAREHSACCHNGNTHETAFPCGFSRPHFSLPEWTCPIPGGQTLPVSRAADRLGRSLAVPDHEKPLRLSHTESERKAPAEWPTPKAKWPEAPCDLALFPFSFSCPRPTAGRPIDPSSRCNRAVPLKKRSLGGIVATPAASL